MQTYYKEQPDQILNTPNNILYVNHNVETYPINKKANLNKQIDVYKIKKLSLTKNHRNTLINTPIQSKL